MADVRRSREAPKPHSPIGEGAERLAKADLLIAAVAGAPMNSVSRGRYGGCPAEAARPPKPHRPIGKGAERLAKADSLRILQILRTDSSPA